VRTGEERKVRGRLSPSKSFILDVDRGPKTMQGKCWQTKGLVNYRRDKEVKFLMLATFRSHQHPLKDGDGAKKGSSVPPT